jgi:hypothetical protein
MSMRLEQSSDFEVTVKFGRIGISLIAVVNGRNKELNFSSFENVWANLCERGNERTAMIKIGCFQIDNNSDLTSLTPVNLAPIQKYSE